MEGDWVLSSAREKRGGRSIFFQALHHRFGPRLNLELDHQHKQKKSRKDSRAHHEGTMSSPREGPNPLRPYYVPPSIGLSPASPASNPSPAANAAASPSTKVFGSSARDLLPDLNYSEYLESSPSVSDWLKDVLDRALWKYASVLSAQPFDVAKTILQVYVVPDAQDGQTAQDRRRKQSPGYRDEYYEDVRRASCPSSSLAGLGSMRY